jgi:hypothetical protein
MRLNFLDPGKNYKALIFSDNTHQTMNRDVIEVNAGSSLTLSLIERGGFACRFSLKD